MGSRLARVDINDLKLKKQRDSNLRLGQILADELSRDLISAFGELGKTQVLFELKAASRGVSRVRSVTSPELALLESM